MVNRWKLSLAFGGVVLAGLAAILAVVATDAFGGESERRTYEVRVAFGTTATQDDLDEVEALLRSLDPDVDFVVMESFPPIGSARMESGDRDLCEQVSEALGDPAYIDDLSCKLWSGGGGADPDKPVGSGG